jgi:hypothetical protein
VSDALPALPSGPVTSIAEVIARKEAIAAALPVTDGVACFNRLYLTVTREVEARVGSGFYSDPAFVTRLDVVFANIYFDALDDWNRRRKAVPRSWAVLIRRRKDDGLAPLQFALAGMNAHINRDLPIAVVETCRQLATSPDADAHEADYEKVNELLGDLEPAIQESFEEGILLELDRQFAGIDNLAATFSIKAAREVAWNNALTLWTLRDERFLARPFLDGLDRLVAFAGRSLLLPLPRL